MSSPGVLGLTDVTPRMALFGQMFLQQAGTRTGVAQLPDAHAAVDVVRATMPRSTAPADGVPVFEAAAFLGEWLRSRGLPASWVAEGPGEPQFQATDETGSIAYVLPLVSVVRVASTAGYDGLAKLLSDLLGDLAQPAIEVPLAKLRVHPPADAPRVVSWARDHLAPGVTAAVLTRRCRACGESHDTEIHLDDAHPLGWLDVASLSASQLAIAPFECACGGTAGEQSRFLLLHDDGTPESAHRFLDVLTTGAQTRVASWRIRDGVATPLRE